MIALRIKELRKALKLTQEQFGRQLGCSRYVISNIEYERVVPKKVFLDHVVKIFHANPDWLYRGEGEMFSSPQEEDRELLDAMEIFGSLSPKLKAYALSQLRGLLDLQNAQEDPEEKP